MNDWLRGRGRAVLVGIGFGLAAAAVVRCGATIAGDHQIFGMDGAAVFVTLGSAICGPKVAILIGLIGGLGDVYPSTYITVPWHILGGLWVGWSYQRWVCRQPSTLRMLGAWLLTLAVYYPVIQGLLAMVLPLVVPASVYHEALGELSPAAAYVRAMHYEWPEIAFTVMVTGIAWLALPKSARRPLTEPPTRCDWAISDAAVRQRLAQQMEASGPPPAGGGSLTRWLVALTLGVLALAMVRGQLAVPVDDVRGGVLDGREVLVTFGSALCGPAAALLLGFMAGIGDRLAGIGPFSAVAHAAAGCLLALLFRRWLPGGSARAFWWTRWLALVSLYYVVMYGLGMLLLLPFPGYLSSLLVDPRRSAVGVLATTVYPEYLFTLLSTTVLWWAAPRRLQHLARWGSAEAAAPRSERLEAVS